MFHMEKLMPNMKLRKDYDFEDYAMKLWMKDKVIKEMANFTGYEVKEDQIEKLVDHCNIEKFKKNDAVNMKPPKGVVPDEVRDNFTFIRKGKVGDWRNFFKDESKLKEFDHWIQTNNTLD